MPNMNTPATTMAGKKKAPDKNLRDFLGNSRNGISFDFGLEYLIKP